MKKLKILYLEDSKFDTEILSRFLSKTIPDSVLKQVDTKESYKKELIDFCPDIILSDHSLFQFNSVEALAIVKENNLDIPFILLTGTVSEEFAVNILKEGADDYILKSNLSRLQVAITNALKERKIKKEKENYELKLIEKNSELNTLIYKITHDLRGPVCSILGLVNLAKKKEISSDEDYLEKISETTIKLDHILQTLLETMYSREAEVEPDKIIITELINEILKKFEYIAEYKKVKIELRILGENFILSDKRILSSILQNLIENSFKYRNLSIENPSILIEINSNDDLTEIKITDNGIGINDNIKGNIFEMFFRGNDDSKGSGLGLYLVQKGIEKLKGNIQFESVALKGTTFILRLPH